MRQLEPKRITIGEVEYAIYPFGAFDAAAISGDLAKMIGPFIVSILPLVSSDVSDEDVEKLGPALTTAFQSLDGEKLQSMLRQLLIVKKNIVCEYRDDSGQPVQKTLTIELANELFIGNLDDMVTLAVEVVNFNFAGFFTQIFTRFGNRSKSTRKKVRKTSGSSTREGFQILS